MKLASEPLGPRDGSRSFWSLEKAAPRASGASRWLLPEPLEPRYSCSQSLWSLGWLLPTTLEPRDSCCLEKAVEETVEEASKLFEDAQLGTTL